MIIINSKLRRLNSNFTERFRSRKHLPVKKIFYFIFHILRTFIPPWKCWIKVLSFVFVSKARRDFHLTLLSMKNETLGKLRWCPTPSFFENVNWYFVENSKKPLRWNYGSANYLWQITYGIKVLKTYLIWPNLTPNNTSVYSLITYLFRSPPQSVLSSPNTSVAPLQALVF